MIAFALSRSRAATPRMPIGGDYSATRRERRRGRGMVRRRGRRAGPHNCVGAGRRSRSSSTSSSTITRSSFARRGGRRCSMSGSSTSPHVCPRRDPRARRFFPSRCRASTTAGMQPRRLPPSSTRASPARKRSRTLPRTGASLAGSSSEEKPAAFASYDDTRITDVRSRRRWQPRVRRGARRVLVLFQPHLFSRTRHLAPELGAALAGADAVAAADVYAAREQQEDGVRGKLVVEAVADSRHGRCVSRGCRRLRTVRAGSPGSPGPETSY